MFYLLMSFNDRYQIPDPWPYEEARRLFKEPLVTQAEDVPDFKWTAPDAEVVLCNFI